MVPVLVKDLVMALGYRDPLTYKAVKGNSNQIRLSLHVLNVEHLVRCFRNEELHQYLHELEQGMDPRQSEWFMKIKFSLYEESEMRRLRGF